MTLIALILPVFSKIGLAYISLRLAGVIIGSGVFYSNNSILILFATILTFLSFLLLNIENYIIKKIIIKISKYSLAVYLIHDNSNISENLWKCIRKFLHVYSISIIVEFLFVIVSIYIICLIIDIIREYIFKFFKEITGYSKLDTFINEQFFINEPFYRKDK